MDMAWPSPSDLLAPLAPWFEAERRDLPWRAWDLDAPHPEPYAVLVSELMLQQTQVATVIPYFERWMRRFPDTVSLAGADSDEIHALWQGLGYYRRARFLQAAARHVAIHGWPTSRAALAQLPGVGPYTASALAAIAFQQPEAALDGNAFRVFARLLALRESSRGHARPLEIWLRPALIAHGPSRLTQAIMELGATVCQPAPACSSCPLIAACQARQLGLERELPLPQPRPEPRQLTLHLLAVEADGHWLLHPPRAKGLLSGLWQWPGLEAVSEGDFTLPFEAVAPCESWMQVYTHRREQVHPQHVSLAWKPAPPEGCCWVPSPELEGLPMGKRDQRLRQALSNMKKRPAAPDGNTRALLATIFGY